MWHTEAHLRLAWISRCDKCVAKIPTNRIGHWSEGSIETFEETPFRDCVVGCSKILRGGQYPGHYYRPHPWKKLTWICSHQEKYLTRLSMTKFHPVLFKPTQTG